MMRSEGGEPGLDWEDYLTAAVSGVEDKYQARRYKAHLRAQLLEHFEQHRRAGLSRQDAMGAAMRAVGDPGQVAERVSAPIKYQRGWLWMLSLAQLTVGVVIVFISLRTQSFSALALGRIMTLWGAVSAGFQARRVRRVGIRLKFFQLRMQFHRRDRWVRDIEKMALVGFFTGILVALVASVPWNIVTTNMFHPVTLAIGSSLLMSGIVVAWPWMRLRHWLGPAFFVVSLQAWAALAASIGSTALILWHEGFAPPPLFNWQPEMLLMGGWVFYFMVLRLVTVLAHLRERALLGLDDDRSPSF
jgi:hypothetical protein